MKAIARKMKPEDAAAYLKKKAEEKVQRQAEKDEKKARKQRALPPTEPWALERKRRKKERQERRKRIGKRFVRQQEDWEAGVDVKRPEADDDGRPIEAVYLAFLQIWFFENFCF